ncbi:MAG TPA: hypothetical protein VGE44_08175 [Daejeonella sp.]|jgi:hypothetical protein|uniref:hypothetical protein n=1 Tax=Daejeonella sp. TaxID=2805397 RepID=UPI002EDAD83E
MSTQNHQSKQKAVFQNLRNFCSSYSLIEADEMLCRAFTVMLGGGYSKQSLHNKKRLLDYFEALEEVLPALYELQEKLKHVQNQEGKEDIYQNQVSTKDLFASFKRHPE